MLPTGQQIAAEMLRKPIYGEISESQIAEWKAKYGEVKVIQIVVSPEIVEQSDQYGKKSQITPADIAVAYVKNPGRKEVGAMMKHANEPMASLEALFNGCFLGGDKRFDTNVGLFNKACELISSLIEQYEGSIKNA